MMDQIAPQLHYASSFQLLPRDAQAASIWTKVVKSVRAWIVRKVGGSDLLGASAFYTGGMWRFANGMVRTARAIAGADETAPKYWAVRVEHPCSEVPHRTWRTDVGLTILDDQHIAVVLTNGYWLRPGYIGDEPPIPVPSAPGIVTALLTARDWSSHAGNMKLSLLPFTLSDGQGEAFQELLEDESRECPVVLVAKERQSATYRIDPSRLARLLAGSAVVYVAATTTVDDELEWVLPKTYRCYDGMVRIYQPGLNPKHPTDYRRHRFFLKDDIEQRGATAVEETLLRGLVRRPRRNSIGDVLSVEEVLQHERDFNLAKLRETARSNDEWIKLVEEDNRAKTEQVKERDKTIEQLQARETEYLQELEEAKHENTSLKHQREMADDRAKKAERDSARIQRLASLLSDLEELPDSVSEVVELVAKVYDSKLAFTEAARRSAKDATLNNVNVAWKCLRAMATTLWNLHFVEKLPFREIVKGFKEKSSLDLAVGESEQTRQNRKLADLRRDTYKGRTVDISTHIKWGRAAPNCLRIHYYADREDQLLVIGHCGDHLDTIRTS